MALTREEAREIILEVAGSNGHIRPDMRRRLSVVTGREEFERCNYNGLLQRVNNITKNFAHGLYSSNDRFLLELVQNAEDLSYKNAKENSRRPEISFTLTANQLLVDSNEDGFTKENVKAICGISESDKKLSEKVGHKGIGFKSVFNVASRAQIQSGPFCFHFDVPQDAEMRGLRMLLPIPSEFENLPAETQTRITLSSIGDNAFEQQRPALESLGSVLLFLRTLKVLHVSYADADGGLDDYITYKRCDYMKGKRRSILTYHGVDSQDPHKTRYIIQRCHVRELPLGEDRETAANADIELAFPVDAHDTPLIEDNQKIFAFLPVTNAGFRFSIQSDFDVTASREMVPDTPRNKDLYIQVAKVFCSAVERFSRMEKLWYEWYKYYPLGGTQSFSRVIASEVTKLLRDTRILRSWTRGENYKPSELFYLPRTMRDEDGSPLLEDLRHEQYLAEEYSSEAFEVLNRIGVRELSPLQFVERLEADLDRHHSHVRQADTDSGTAHFLEWTRRMAPVLKSIIAGSNKKSKSKLRELKLVPLCNGRWISVSGNDIIRERCENNSKIPQDLELQILDESKLPAWLEFFIAMGVRKENHQTVVEEIKRKYRDCEPPVKDKTSSLAHMHFMFQNNKDDALSHVFDNYGKLRECMPLEEYPRAYFKRPNDDLGPGKLLKDCKDAAFMVHSIYFKAPAGNSRKKWLKWLKIVQGISDVPRLEFQIGNKTKLSKEFYHIVEQHNGKLLSLLKRNWKLYKDLAKGTKSKIAETSVPSEDGSNIPVGEGYLPTSKLKGTCRRHGLTGKKILLLKQGKNEIDSGDQTWNFLTEVGAKRRDDAHFYCEAIRYYQDKSILTKKDRKCVFQLFNQLNRNCVDEDIPQRERQEIRNAFNSERLLVLVPIRDTADWIWQPTSQCLWEGPDWYLSKHCIANMDEYKILGRLFDEIVCLSNSNLDDSLFELRHRKTNQVGEIERINEVYAEIEEFVEQGGKKEEEQVRDAFEKHKLVYDHEHQEWHAPSSCLWAQKQIKIRDKVLIEGLYPEREILFMDILHVKPPDVRTCVDALVQLAEKVPPLKKNREGFFSKIEDLLSYIAGSEFTADEVKPLRKAEVFIVRKHQEPRRLTSAKGQYAIPDHTKYCELFQDKLPMLQIRPENLMLYDRLFRKLGMKRRYLSILVDQKPHFTKHEKADEHTRQFRAKAKVLYSCVVKFRGSTPELYRQLCAAIVYQAFDLSNLLTVKIGKDKYKEKDKPCLVHVKRTQDKFKIFIPQTKRKQERCYLRELPVRVAECLGMPEERAKRLITAIFAAKTVKQAEDLLVDEGIDLVEKKDIGLGRAKDQPDEWISDVEETTLIEEPGLDSDATQLESDIQALRIGASPEPESQTDVIDLTRIDSSEQGSAGSRPTTPQVDGRYAEILEYIVQAARTSSIPRRGAASSSSSRRKFHGHHLRSIGLQLGWDRDSKIGAAGELFVYELLKRHMGDFTPNNWSSKIRTHVTVHQDYAQITRWSRSPEISDLWYKDVTGEFTKQLIELGYLERDEVDKGVKYFIEVKTTTSHCEWEFYMGSRQYELMKSLRLPHDRRAKKVYILCRVFYIDEREIGMRIYVDPWAEMYEGNLNFSISKWRGVTKRLGKSNE